MASRRSVLNLNFTVVSKHLVQYMLENGCVPLESALKFCQNVAEDENLNMVTLKTLIIEINRDISKQFFKLTIAKCEVTEEEKLVWLNLKNDKISRMQITFSELELEYFNSLLQEIMNSAERRLPVDTCTNITSTLSASFSRQSGQKVLEIWLKEGYFTEHDDYIHLGIRTVLEFTSYLKASQLSCCCTLCSELVFTGKICASCYEIFHSYCLNKFWQAQSIQNICPSCKADWEEAQVFANVLNGENHNDGDNYDSDQSNRQSSSSNRTRSTRNNKRRRTQDQSVDVVDNYMNSQPGCSNTQRNRKLINNVRNVNDSSESD